MAEKNLSAVRALVWVARGGDIAGSLSWPLCLLWVVCNLCLDEVCREVCISYSALPCHHFSLGNQSCIIYSLFTIFKLLLKQWGWRHVLINSQTEPEVLKSLFTARHIFPLERHTLEVAHIIQKGRPVAFWRSSLLIYIYIYIFSDQNIKDFSLKLFRTLGRCLNLEHLFSHLFEQRGNKTTNFLLLFILLKLNITNVVVIPQC